MLSLGNISSNLRRSTSSAQKSTAPSLKGSKSKGLFSMKLVLMRDQNKEEALWLEWYKVDILGASPSEYYLRSFIEKLSSSFIVPKYIMLGQPYRQLKAIFFSINKSYQTKRNSERDQITYSSQYTQITFIKSLQLAMFPTIMKRIFLKFLLELPYLCCQAFILKNSNFIFAVCTHNIAAQSLQIQNLKQSKMLTKSQIFNQENLKESQRNIHRQLNFKIRLLKKSTKIAKPHNNKQKLKMCKILQQIINKHSKKQINCKILLYYLQLMNSEGDKEDVKNSITFLQRPVQISLDGKVLELGNTWKDISHNLYAQRGTCSEKTLCAIKVCLIERLSSQLSISQTQKIAAMRQYVLSSKKK